jgi:hypothetical protein
MIHEKNECKTIKSSQTSPPLITIEVHFGSDLGQNIQIYYQHLKRAYALIRGKQIIKSIYDHFKKIVKGEKESLSNPNVFVK